jgi:nicotinate-nucleotide adenylyltransferase
MKIGILGGTFDPPHTGHLALARAAMEQLELDEVLLLPANRNPLKETRPVASGRERLEMTQRLVQDEPNMGVSDQEITRGGPSYSVDTVTELYMARPADYWFLIGADALKTVPEWKNVAKMLRMCRLGVAVRPPMTDHDVMARAPTEFRDRIDVVKMKPMDVSSTEIRRRIGEGRPVSAWLPPPVLKYVEEKRLYR